MSEDVPGPSRLRRAAAYLSARLPTIDAPADGLARTAGVLTIPVGGAVFLNTETASVPLQCGRCRQMVGGEVRVDGPDAVYVCADGHETRDRRLEGLRVRVAAAYARTSPPVLADRIDLQVASALHADPGADPRRVFGLHRDYPQP